MEKARIAIFQRRTDEALHNALTQAGHEITCTAGDCARALASVNDWMWGDAPEVIVVDAGLADGAFNAGDVVGALKAFGIKDAVKVIAYYPDVQSKRVQIEPEVGIEAYLPANLNPADVVEAIRGL